MPFYSDALTNMTKLHASKQMESYGLVKYAILKEYDPENCIVKVGWYNANTDDYDSLISGWLPIIVPFIGAGDDTQQGGTPWGFVAPPNIGQPVVVLSQHGDFNNGLVIGGTYSSLSPVPQADGEYTQDGEFLVFHKTGSFFKFYNNGDVKVHTDHDLIFDVGHDWNVTVANDTIFNLKGNFTRTVAKDESATIRGNQSLDLAGNRSDTIRGNDSLNLTGNRDEGIGGNDSKVVSGTVSVDATGAITFNSGAAFVVHAPIIELD